MPFKDPERKRAYQREWVGRNASRHREQSRAGVKRWRKRHPEEHRACRRRYHAENAARLNAQIAAWHHAHPEGGVRRPLEPDHRIPLKRGGPNVIANIIPACGPCNRRKAGLTEDEFRERLAREARKDIHVR